MTVSSNASKAGPYAGSGTTGPFSFGFTTFSKNDIKVVRADASGAETILVVDSDYTVSLNSDQVASPGGTITLMSALATGFKLAITGNVAYAQTTQLPNGGAYNATTVERAIDRQVQISKQLQEQVDRAVKVTVTSGTSPDSLIASINNAASSAAASATSANAAWDAFQGQYYGASAANPATDPLGNAPTAGDLYWNTAVPEMRVYSGSSWGAVAATVSTPTQLFNGTGAQTAFTLSGAPGSLSALEVFISGVRQRPTTDYTLSGTTLTFLSAPPTGTNNIFVRWISTQAIGVPSDGTVTAAKMAAGAAVGNLGYTPVSNTGNETIAGIKTFSSPPVFASTPTVTAAQSMVRLNTSNGYGSTNTCILRFTNTVTNQGSDITYADSATLGASLTINTNGVYSISANYYNAATNGVVGISLNTSQPTTSIRTINAADRLAHSMMGTVAGTPVSAGVVNANWTGYLAAGSVLRVHADTGGTSSAAEGQVTVVRIS